MGISLQQYRAAIGLWTGRGVKHVSSPITPSENNETIPCPLEMDSRWKIKGNRKLHLALLVLLITQLIVVIPPTTSSALSSYVPYTWKQTWEEAADPVAPLSPQCLEKLLVIGCVEVRPGPTNAEILADLSSQAPSYEVRDCLRCYNIAHSEAQLTRDISRFKKKVLMDTLEYLKQPPKPGDKKTTNISNIICRIQNLLTDNCGICNSEYSVKLNDTPLLCCVFCGQGSHDPCIYDLLNIDTLDLMSVSRENIMEKINPTKMKGWHYVCPECEKNKIPECSQNQPDSSALSEHTDDEDDTLSASQLQQSQDETNNAAANPGDPPNEDEPTATPDTNHHETTESGDEDDEDEDEELRTVIDGMSPVQDSRKKPAAQNQTTNHSNSSGGQSSNHAESSRPTISPWKNNNTCHFYLKGTCRNGLSGKKCPKEHPPACKKLLKHGAKGRLGCKKGTSCSNFHPKMCQTSLSKGECFNPDCKLVHVSGTKRREENQTKKNVTIDQNVNENPPNPLNTFLEEALLALETRIMAALDQKLAKTMQTAAPLHHQMMPEQVQQHREGMTPYWYQHQQPAPATQRGAPNQTQGAPSQTIPHMVLVRNPQY